MVGLLVTLAVIGYIIYARIKRAESREANRSEWDQLNSVGETSGGKGGEHDVHSAKHQRHDTRASTVQLHAPRSEGDPEGSSLELESLRREDSPEPDLDSTFPGAPTVSPRFFPERDCSLMVGAECGGQDGMFQNGTRFHENIDFE